ncbi:MAG: AAA family ATPase [archaeon]|nr:AAA family ATPase [archaeon]
MTLFVDCSSELLPFSKRFSLLEIASPSRFHACLRLFVVPPRGLRNAPFRPFSPPRYPLFLRKHISGHGFRHPLFPRAVLLADPCESFLAVDERTLVLQLPPAPALDPSPLPHALKAQATLLAALLDAKECRSILLSGPSGCGKSHVAAAALLPLVAAGTPVVELPPGCGESEEMVALVELAHRGGCLLLVEWVDAIPLELLRLISIRLAKPWQQQQQEGEGREKEMMIGRRRMKVLAMTHCGKLDDLLPYFDEHVAFDRTPQLLTSLVQSFPDTPWEAVGGLEGVKLQLQQSVVWRKTHAAGFARLGVRPPSAVLLFGPPGCGKTLLAKATATEVGASFVSISITDVVKSYVGESEKALAAIFKVAAQSSPCVLFIDEIQAIFRTRSADSVASIGLITTLLMCMDSLALNDVFLLGATNRPQDIDPSFLRSGRFDRLIYVPPPPPRSRLAILRAYTRRMPLDPSVDLPLIAASHTNLFTGSDLYNLCRHAAFAAAGAPVQMQHFVTAAYSSCTPSLSHAMIRGYERLSSGLSRSVRAATSSTPTKTPDWSEHSISLDDIEVIEFGM